MRTYVTRNEEEALAMIGAAVYAVSPIDLIPDVIPVLCWVDDLFVILMALKYKPAGGPPALAN